jgi:hypothetical protein
MPARTELDRLTAARPAILSRTEDVVDAAEENRILQHIFSATAGAPAQASVPPPGRTHRLTRRLTGALAAAAATALMAGGVLTLAGTGASSPGPRQSTAARPAQTAPRTGPVIRLARYTFTMPAGFTAIARPCAPMPDRTGLPTRGRNPFTAAASSKGGCLEAVLAAGPAAVIPDTAQPIQVGPYQGFVSRGPAASVILYVKMPAADGNHDLILLARRLSPAQVVAIATSGLPATIGPIHACTKNCG